MTRKASEFIEEIASLQVLDPAQLKQMPASLVPRMIAMFEDLVPKSLALIDGHLEKDELEALSEESHKLKGYALQLGLNKLSRLASILQNESSLLPREEAAALAGELPRIFGEACAALKSST